jgi:hypothetical protein
VLLKDAKKEDYHYRGRTKGQKKLVGEENPKDFAFEGGKRGKGKGEKTE